MPAISAAGPKPPAKSPAYKRWWRLTKNELDPGWSARLSAAYRLQHPDRTKAYKHAFYVRHRKKLMAETNARRRKDPEHYRTYSREYQRKRYEANPHMHRHLRYGLTKEQLAALFVAQHNACGICGCDLSTIKKSCVDHCHVTKVVRGVLCDPCNRGLGSFQDSPERLQSAIDYLRLHS